MESEFKVGTLLFLGSLECLFEVIAETEKAICVQRDSSGKKTWIPKSGLKKKKRHYLLHEFSPDTYMVEKWVKASV